ncbi:MAG: ABC transporter permease subunit [Clostridia bacterium]|nr:ABC transporter permease subunit [Clostridia bacterium]
MVKRFFIKRKLDIICSVAALVLIALVWIIAYYSVRNDYIIPSLGETVKSFFICLGQKTFWTAVGFTFLRTAVGFVISFVLALACAALSACSKIVAAALKPFMVILRTLPTLAVILILLIWTTPGAAPVIVTVLVLFPMIYSQISAAIGGIDDGLREMADVYRISKRDRLFKIYLPSACPNILSQTGADISLGLKIMISAEVLASTYRSLGNLMQTARLYLDTPRLAALTVAAVVIGFIVEIAFSQFARITYKWSKKEGGND